jgi:hypothetical protein
MALVRGAMSVAGVSPATLGNIQVFVRYSLSCEHTRAVAASKLAVLAGPVRVRASNTRLPHIINFKRF